MVPPAPKNSRSPCKTSAETRPIGQSPGQELRSSPPSHMALPQIGACGGSVGRQSAGQDAADSLAEHAPSPHLSAPDVEPPPVSGAGVGVEPDGVEDGTGGCDGETGGNSSSGALGVPDPS